MPNSSLIDQQKVLQAVQEIAKLYSVDSTVLSAAEFSEAIIQIEYFNW